MRALFVSYNGALDSLGQSQVLPYLRELQRDGHAIRLLSFERPAAEAGQRAAALQEQLRDRGIGWTWLWYHKRPPVLSTLWDVLLGMAVTFWLTVRYGIHVLHARSQVAAAMVWPVARLLRRRFVFDLRGQMAYEYADGGTWSEGGLIYRLVERAERRFIKDADAIVVLTRVLAGDLRTAGVRPPVVIPTCVDLQLFAPPAPGGRLATMAYCGSLGARYAPELLVAFYLEAARKIPGLRLLLLTHSDPSLVKQMLADAGSPAERCNTMQARHQEVPDHLTSALFGVLLLRGARSLRGACPTKVGEYLAAGLPVVSSPGIGDLDMLLEQERVGVVLKGHDPEAISEGVGKLIELLAEGEPMRTRCRRFAEKEYSVAGTGGPAYRTLYRSLESRR
ncbi:MAG: glycosyltransferase [Nitrospirae bacterium]|nr:MAG: glycosyltransferase [Nitrospirota bacterium]